jgi:hypothetical protein
MADETENSYDAAKRCPKCEQPGNVRLIDPLLDGKGTTLHHIYCENERCEWYNTPWIVQVNADGTVPPPRDNTDTPKEYRGFEFHDEEAKRVIASLESLNKLSTRPDGHGEIRGR